MKNNNNRKRSQSTPPPKEPEPIPFTVPDLQNFGAESDPSGPPALVVFDDCEEGEAVVDWVLTEGQLKKMEGCAKRCKQSLQDWVRTAIEEKMRRSGAQRAAKAALIPADGILTESDRGLICELTDEQILRMSDLASTRADRLRRHVSNKAATLLKSLMMPGVN